MTKIKTIPGKLKTTSKQRKLDFMKAFSTRGRHGHAARAAYRDAGYPYNVDTGPRAADRRPQPPRVSPPTIATGYIQVLLEALVLRPVGTQNAYT